MAVPGASTASALLLCVASLSGWCVWQQNCVEDSSVGPFEKQIMDIVQSVQQNEQAATRVTLRSKASPASTSVSELFAEWQQLFELNEIPHVSEHKKNILSAARETKRPASSARESYLAYLSTLSDIDNVVDAVDISKETPVPFHATVAPVARQAPVPFDKLGMEVPVVTFLSFLGSFSSFLGIAFFVDVFLAVGAITLYRRVFPKQVLAAGNTTTVANTNSTVRSTPAPANSDTTFTPQCFLQIERPIILQAKAPANEEALAFPVDSCASTESVIESNDEAKESFALPMSALQAQINAIVSDKKPRKQFECSPAPRSSTDDLQAQINAIFEKTQSSPAPQCLQFEGVGSPAVQNEDVGSPAVLQCQINAIVGNHRKQPFIAPRSDEELKAQINAIMGVHMEHRKQCEQSPAPACSAEIAEESIEEEQLPVALCSDDAIQVKMNAILMKRLSGASPPVASPAKFESIEEEQLPVALCSDEVEHEYQQQLQLQAKMNAILEERKQKRLSGASPPVASPSPAKSMSNAELADRVNLALSAAKERTTPAKSPPGLELPVLVHWEAYGDDVAPCQLNFGEGEDNTAKVWNEYDYEQQLLTGNATEPKQAVQVQQTEPDASLSCMAPPKEKFVDTEKAKTCSFDVREIPSPTRNRARRQQMLEAAQVKSEEAAPAFEETPATTFEGSIAASPEAKTSMRHLRLSPISAGGAIARMLKSSPTPVKEAGARVQRSPRPEVIQYQ